LLVRLCTPRSDGDIRTDQIIRNWIQKNALNVVTNFLKKKIKWWNCQIKKGKILKNRRGNEKNSIRYYKTLIITQKNYKAIISSTKKRIWVTVKKVTNYRPNIKS